jgi:hypothetical protein
MIIIPYSCGNSHTCLSIWQFSRLEGSIEAATSRYTIHDRGKLSFQYHCLVSPLDANPAPLRGGGATRTLGGRTASASKNGCRGARSHRRGARWARKRPTWRSASSFRGCATTDEQDSPAAELRRPPLHAFYLSTWLLATSHRRIWALLAVCLLHDSSGGGRSWLPRRLGSIVRLLGAGTGWARQQRWAEMTNGPLWCLIVLFCSFPFPFLFPASQYLKNLLDPYKMPRRS